VATASSDPAGTDKKFTAWERWSPGVLQDTPQDRRAPQAQDAIERRGYAAGFAQGKTAGFAAGHAEGQALARSAAARIGAVADAAEAALQALGGTLAQKTLALAVAIARQILQREIASCPDHLLDVVRDALTLLPEGEPRVRLIVNSADVELLRGALPQLSDLPACSVTGSDDVARGGCRIVSPSGDIDATLQTRVSRVLGALGAAGAQDA
jgi:flagellar assembly protein FliH